jgi:predicted MFS family arabinose efflux permease
MNTLSQKPGWRQGSVLMAGSCMPILGAVLLGPVLPDIQRHFATTPHVEIMVPVMLTLPALMIGLCSAFAGLLADRFGRRPLLLGALCCYGVFGTAPLWLNTLPHILLSRVGLGITEAIIMTACTTLIGDYFEGAARQKWLSLQGAVASLAATLLFGIGGALGEFGWRTPFWLYALSFVLLPLCVWLLWEPTTDKAARPGMTIVKTGLPWAVLGAAYPFSVLTGMALLLVPVQSGFLLNQLGVMAPAVIGLVSAANQGAVLVGSLVFRLVIRFGYAMVFLGAFILAGAGLILVGVGDSQSSLLVGGIINGFGCGLLLVALLNWAMGTLPVAVRGRGTGGFIACLFFGEFLSPLAVLALRHGGFTLAASIGLCGCVMVACAVAGLAAPLFSGTSRPVPHLELSGRETA